VVLHKLRLRQTAATVQILYSAPSLQLVAARAAAQLRVLLAVLAVRVVAQEIMAHQELLALAQQIKVLQVAHQLARLETTQVPVVAVQVRLPQV